MPLDLASLEARLLAPLPDLSTLSPEEQFAYIEEKAAQGTEAIVTKAQLLARLKKAKKEGKPLRFKLGIDPTGPEIHLGHAIPLINLRRIHRMGHAIDLLFGDFTAMVGDPGGRMDERPALTADDVKRNVATYERQASHVLDLRAERVKIHYNSAWLGKLSLTEWLKLTKGIGVSQLLQREDFRKRLDAGLPLSLAEAEYALLMGYDSVELKSDVEVGGVDQFLNFHFCRNMMEAAGQEPESFVCFDLLPGTSGEKDEQGRLRKMSKSRGNYIAVEASPEDKYGKVMSVPDEVMWVWFREITEIRTPELAALKAEVSEGRLHPKEAKRLLARVVVATFHGYDKAAVEKAQAAFDQKFGAAKVLVPEDTKLSPLQSGDAEIRVESPEIFPNDVIGQTRITSMPLVGVEKVFDHFKRATGESGGQVRRLVKQKGIHVLSGSEYMPISDEILDLDAAYLVGKVIRIGKKNYIKFEPPTFGLRSDSNSINSLFTYKKPVPTRSDAILGHDNGSAVFVLDTSVVRGASVNPGENKYTIDELASRGSLAIPGDVIVEICTRIESEKDFLSRRSAARKVLNARPIVLPQSSVYCRWLFGAVALEEFVRDLDIWTSNLAHFALMDSYDEWLLDESFRMLTKQRNEGYFAWKQDHLNAFKMTEDISASGTFNDLSGIPQKDREAVLENFGFLALILKTLEERFTHGNPSLISAENREFAFRHLFSYAKLIHSYQKEVFLRDGGNLEANDRGDLDIMIYASHSSPALAGHRSIVVTKESVWIPLVNNAYGETLAMDPLSMVIPKQV